MSMNCANEQTCVSDVSTIACIYFNSLITIFELFCFKIGFIFRLKIKDKLKFIHNNGRNPIWNEPASIVLFSIVRVGTYFHCVSATKYRKWQTYGEWCGMIEWRTESERWSLITNCLKWQTIIGEMLTSQKQPCAWVYDSEWVIEELVWSCWTVFREWKNGLSPFRGGLSFRMHEICILKFYLSIDTMRKAPNTKKRWKFEIQQKTRHTQW